MLSLRAKASLVLMPKRRLDNEDRTVGHGRKRGKIFADPLCALGPSAQAEGDVRAAADGNLLELLQRKTDLGQMIQGSQHSGSVSAAAAQTRHHRDALDQMNDDRIGQGRKSAPLKKGAGAAHRNVAVVARQRQSLSVGTGAGHLEYPSRCAVIPSVCRTGPLSASPYPSHGSRWEAADDVQRKIDFAGGMDGD